MSEIDDILHIADACAARGEPFALATVVAVHGSSYRRPGARLLVPADGAPVGLISGGCLEDEAARMARELLHDERPALRTIDHSQEGDEVWGWGLGCRGVIELLVEPSALAAETVDALRDAHLRGRPSMLLTGLDGTRRRVSTDEAVALSPDAARSGRPVRLDDQVLDAILPPPHLLVCGAGPDAEPLVAEARRLALRVTVADTRRSRLDPDRFPGARLVDADAGEIGSAAGIDERTAVVLMSHDYMRDLDYLRGVAGHGAAYIGLLGPRERTDRLLEELRTSLTDADLAALHAPAGLDIGADGAGEVATAIVAEILAVFRGRPGGHLRDRQGAIHG